MKKSKLLNTTKNRSKFGLSKLLLLVVLLLPIIGYGQCTLVVDCSNIVDQQLACRADLPPVDFTLPIVVDSCGDITLSALTIIPGNTACPNDTLFVPRTYFIQDAAGNTEQCMQTFTIISTMDPTFTFFPSDTTVLCGAATDPTATGMAEGVGECHPVSPQAVVTFNDAITPGASPQEMAITRTWTVTDRCDRSVDMDQIIMVVDTIAPMAMCQDVTLSLDENGMASLETGDSITVVTGSLDNTDPQFDRPIGSSTDCFVSNGAEDHFYDVFEFSIDAQDMYTFMMAEVPTADMYFLLYEGGFNPAAPCGNHINGDDDDGPANEPELMMELMLVPGNYTLVTTTFFSNQTGDYIINISSANGGNILPLGGAMTSQINGGSTDNCDDSELRYSESMRSFTCENLGDNIVVLTVTDPSGNSDTCEATVTVEDNIDPVITCPADIVIQLMEEQCDTLAAIDIPDFTDNCPDAVITQIEGVTFGTPFPIGENVVSFEARDISGNVDTCTFSITVLDFIPNGMACNGEINFSVDEMTCSGSLTASMLTDISSIGCADSCTITVMGADGIVRPPNFTADDIGKTFQYEICCGGICCWGDVNVEYKFKPVIICIESDTLSCTQSFDESLITPDISMSCADVTLITVDEIVEQLSCDSMFTAKMTTLYTAIDEYGNTSDTCTQTIYLKRTNLDSITPVLPFALYNNSALYCGSGFATTNQGYPFPALSVTGAPRLKLENGGFVDLYPFNSNVICNGYAEFSDEILAGSTSCVTKILRTFTIGEWWCSETNQRQFVQLIEVVDFTGPTVTCPNDLTISTSNFSCEGFISVDLPTVGDACNDDNIRIDLSAPTSSTGFIKDYTGQTIMLPAGENELTYRVYDDCGNRTDCTFTVTVRDDADPIAVCDQFTTVGIGLDDLTHVTAEAIDDGSFDECGPVKLEVARMDSPGFDDLIGFGPAIDVTCEDVGRIVMVGLLVTDAGGNTNMCMVSVEVQDKIDAKFTCPGDMEVECNFPYDPDNLGAFFGEVVIYDNCPAANTVEDRLLGSLNSCGSGVLVREIRLLNAQGEQVDYCTQEITFRNGDRLQYSDITPPQSEYTVTGCGIETIDPSILGMPIVPDGVCQQVAIGIENDTFPFTANGACLKIIRTFKVIDWCISDGPGSIFDPFVFTQTIKVNNTVGPEIENVFADSVFCSYSVGCIGININNYLTATSSDDCTATDDLLNRYEVKDLDGNLVRFGGGLDASGFYDVGKYTVRFLSEDKCGNQVFEESTFEVRSCKLPTPYCLQGLSTSLIAMDTTGDGTADVEMVMLPVDYFDAGSYHPCGYDIQLSFSADVNDTIKSFFCSDTVGLQMVELWVTDENGGQSYCTTFIDIQDNDAIDLCGGLKPVDIAGRIYTESDAELSEAEVELKSSESLLTTTDENGMYEFANMPEGGDYQVVAYKDNDHLNGVSTLDLVMIQRHILGISPLTSVYKMIAADINNNEKLSASDLVALRKVILGIETSFPNNTSWRFIDAGYEFVNEANPWEVEIEEKYDIIGLSEDMQIDFIAVKTGDVNGNVDMNIAAGAGIEKRSSTSFKMELPDLTVENGSLYKVEVRGVEAMKLFGMQHTLTTTELDLIDVIPGKMDMQKEYISIEGEEVHVSYVSANGDQINSNEVLFTMVFKAKQDGQLSDFVKLSNNGLKAESYQGDDLSKGDIEISWREEENGLVELAVLEGNMPNPWSVSTELRFYIPTDGKVNLNVKDASGRILMRRASLFTAGNNYFIISQDDIKLTGVFFYELQFEDQIFNGKMIRIK